MKPKNVFTIFILDDDVLCLAFAQQALLNAGYTNVHLFMNADNLFQALKTEIPDVIFLDYNMEPYNGIDVLYCIKKNQPSVPVVFLSGQEDVQTALDALEYGAADYIVKGATAGKRIEKTMAKLHGQFAGAV